MFVIYTTTTCSFCDKAKELLKKKGFDYQEIRVHKDITREKFIEKFNKTTVPQVFHNNILVGGYEALKTYLERV